MNHLDASRQVSGVVYRTLARLLFISLLLLFIYPFFLIVSGVDPSAPIEIQSEMKLVYYLQIVLPFLCVAIAMMYRGPDALLLSLHCLILIYPAVCLTSAIWSVDSYDTIKFACLMVIYILAIGAICQLLDIEVLCKLIVRVLVFLMLASVVMAVAFPRYGTHLIEDGIEGGHAGLWRGVFIHKNQLGAAASVSVFVFLVFPRFISTSLSFRLICIAAATACLIFAQSAGSLVALCVLLVFYCLIRALPVSGNILVLIVFGVSALAFAAFEFFSADFVAMVGRDVTLTGRTEIWRIVLNAIWQNPFLGYGYDAATANFIKPLLIGQVGPAAVDAHNGYLDVMLGTGFLGLTILLYCISSVTRDGITRAKISVESKSDCFLLLVSFPMLSLFFSFFEVAALSSVQGLLGALTFLSLTAIPLYLRLDLRGYRSSAVSRRSASRLPATQKRGTSSWKPATTGR